MSAWMSPGEQEASVWQALNRSDGLGRAGLFALQGDALQARLAALHH